MPTIDTRFGIKTTQSPIFFKSMEAIKSILKKIAGDNSIGVYGVAADSDINREMGRVSQDLSNKSYFNVKLDSLEEDKENSYNSFALMRYGHEPVKLSDGYWYLFHLRPVTATFTIKFFNQDYSKILNFMSNWIFNNREGNFTLKSKDGLDVDIRVIIEGTLSSSDKDFNPGNPYSVTTSLVLKTYVGDIYRCPEVKDIRIERNIISNFTIEDE